MILLSAAGAQAFMERALQILEIPPELQQRVHLGFLYFLFGGLGPHFRA